VLYGDRPRIGPKVESTDVVYDLGSGDGKIPIMAAKKYGLW